MEITLNRKKAYGSIWGHRSASFEQDGHLFDGAGNWVDPEESQEDGEPESFDPALLTTAKDFLKNLLNGGRITEKNVYKEAEIAGHSWEVVKSAAAQMNVSITKMGNSKYWRLTSV